MKRNITIAVLVIAIAAVLFGIWAVWLKPVPEPIQTEDNKPSSPAEDEISESSDAPVEIEISATEEEEENEQVPVVSDEEEEVEQAPVVVEEEEEEEVLESIVQEENPFFPSTLPGFDPDEIIVNPPGSGGEEPTPEPDYLPGVPHDAHIGSF